MGTGKEAQHEELRHELVAELRSLREQVREIAEGYILRKEGEIEALLEYLLRMSPGRLKAVTRHWMAEAKGLKLKPAKGRIKDLKKIDCLLHDLLNQVIEADGEENMPKTAGNKADSPVRRANGIPLETREE